jgi:hypothetical protein
MFGRAKLNIKRKAALDIIGMIDFKIKTYNAMQEKKEYQQNFYQWQQKIVTLSSLKDEIVDEFNIKLKVENHE